MELLTYSHAEQDSFIFSKMYDLFVNTHRFDRRYTPEDRLELSQNCDYWFILYHRKKNIIVAECSVENRHSITKKHFYIQDVWVHPKFRGNNYCIQLLLNVFYTLEEGGIQCSFSLVTQLNNTSAQSAYKKVFGEPVAKDEDYFYFSTE